MIPASVRTAFFVFSSRVKSASFESFFAMSFALVIAVHVLLHHSGNDQRRPRLVDEDAVHLVNYPVIELALDALVYGYRHVVAQVIKAELIVRPVSDVGGVSFFPFGVIHVVLDDPDFQSEEPVYRPHPFAVALGQVIVDGHDVRSLAFESVKVDGERRDKCFSFSRFHLGDLSLMKDNSADKLDVKVPQARGPDRCFSDGRKSFRKDVVSVSPLLILCLNSDVFALSCSSLKAFIAGSRELIFCDERKDLLKFFFVGFADKVKQPF